MALWRDRPPGELATLALKETSLAAVIGYGKTPVSPAALSVRELDLDQAATNLKLAIARGFRDLPHDPVSSRLATPPLEGRS